MCRGCTEEGEVSDKTYPEVKVHALPTFQPPWETSAKCICSYYFVTSILNIWYKLPIQCGEGEKILNLSNVKQMVEF